MSRAFWIIYKYKYFSLIKEFVWMILLKISSPIHFLLLFRLNRLIAFFNSSFCALFLFFFHIVLYKWYFVTGQGKFASAFLRWAWDQRRKRETLSLIDKRNAVNASSKHLCESQVIYLSRDTRINFRDGISDWCWESHALTACHVGQYHEPILLAILLDADICIL